MEAACLPEGHSCPCGRESLFIKHLASVSRGQARPRPTRIHHPDDKYLQWSHHWETVWGPRQKIAKELTS